MNHGSAAAAIKYVEGITAYYERKVAEGKNKMSVLNAIRNKLLSRIFAVVVRETIYQKKYWRCHRSQRNQYS